MAHDKKESVPSVPVASAEPFAFAKSACIMCSDCAHRRIVGHDETGDKILDVIGFLASKMTVLNEKSGGLYFCAAYGRGKPDGVVRKVSGGTRSSYVMTAGPYVGYVLEGRLPIGPVLNSTGQCTAFKPAPPRTLKTFLALFKL